MTGLEARFSLIASMFRSRRFTPILAVSAACFWFVYTFSESMISYYPKAFNLALVVGNLPNPQPVTDEGWYYLGYLWFPNDHLQLTLLAGPVFFSLLLSVLFGISISLFSYSVSARYSLPGLGAAGALGVVPALFSSSAPCCILPLGSLFVAAFVPSVALSTFTFTYGPITSLAIAAIMFVSVLYLSGKIAGSNCEVAKRAADAGNP